MLNSITVANAALQSSDAVKILAGRQECVRASITTMDVWNARYVRLPSLPWIRNFRLVTRATMLCGRNAVQIHDRSRPLDLKQLRAALLLGDVRANDFALRFFPAPYEITIFPDGRAIIKGTTDIGLARELYARYVGS